MEEEEREVERGKRVVTRCDKEVIEKYIEDTRDREFGATRIEDSWKELKEVVKKGLVAKEGGREDRKIGWTKWWDKDCRRQKRYVK